MAFYLFDVDGVLTDTGYNIQPEFYDWFIAWSKEHRYALVTGSTLERTKEQVGETIVENAVFCANCMGNSFYQHGEQNVINDFELNEDEILFLNNKIQNSNFEIKTGNHIVKRSGSVNFSVVGRNASSSQRELYKQYDQLHSERKQIREEFLSKFDRFDVYIGGDISIDICLRNANKSRTVEYIWALPEYRPLYFFGDKMGEHGIDRPLAERIEERDMGQSYEILNGFNQTKSIVSELSQSGISNTNPITFEVNI